MKLLLSLLALVCALAAQPVSAIRCGRLLDVRSGTYVQRAVVLVTGQTIAAVGPADTLAIPPGATVIDLSAATCLPGLIDAHVHITGDPSNSGYKSLGISIPRATLTGAKNARITLQAGFTTVRNVGAKGYADVALRDAIAAGDIEGPRMLVSGPAMGITGGHCDSNLLAPEFHSVSSGVADGPWAARAKVREIVKYGADLIKICASGGVLSKGDSVGASQYTYEEMKAIVEEAHKLDRKVAAHAHGTESIKDAIRAGVDSIEHASLIDAEGIALAKQKGTFLVFDIYNDDFILKEGLKVGMLAESIEKEKQIGKLQRENFRKAMLGGARLAFGTDGGVYPHGDNWRQFPYMVEFGMKPIDSIRAATVEAAELLGLAGKAGAITLGHFADIIAVDGDPLKDVANLQNVKFVMKAGVVYRNDAKIRIALIGDSTVEEEAGWGPGFRASFGPRVDVINHAKGGRSSKSFLDEGRWGPAISSKPNYVLIQFGHNDAPGKGPERETDPKTTFREYMSRYIDESQAAGAQPVLITSIVRRNFTPQGKIAVDSLPPFVTEVRALAVEKKVPLIDLYALTLANAERLGPDGCAEIDARDENGKRDHTHLGPKGQQEIGAMTAHELVKVLPALQSYLK